METAIIAREMLEALNNMSKENIIAKHKFLLKGEDLFLVMLAEMGGMSTPSKLAEDTEFTPARLSAIIKSLEIKGFIVKQQNELDKRCSTVEITDTGLSHTNLLKEDIIKKSIIVIEKLGEKDATEFIRLMKKLSVIFSEL